MIVRQAEAVDAVRVLVLDRDQAKVIELARRLEQHAGPVPRLACRRVRRPRGIAKREVDVGAVRGFVRAPCADRARERQLAGQALERRTETQLQLGAQRIAVEAAPPRRPCTCSSPCAARPGVCRRTAAQARAAPAARPRLPLRRRTAARQNPPDAARWRSAAPTPRRGRARPCSRGPPPAARPAPASAARRNARNAASTRARPSVAYKSGKVSPKASFSIKAPCSCAGSEKRCRPPAGSGKPDILPARRCRDRRFRAYA